MPQSALARTVLIASLLLVAGLLGFVGWRLMDRSTPGEMAVAGVAQVGGPFSLVDQNGERRADADFRGRLMVVFFGFTHCPAICPTELQTISTALDLLGADAAQVAPVFITIDPARDTVEQMKAYAANFHPSLVALTGTDEEIAAAAKAYRVYYNRVAEDGAAADDGDYMMDHSAIVYVMDREGRYLTHFSPGDSAEAMAETLRKHL